MSVIFLIGLIFFVWADAIAIANTLFVLGLFGGALPDWLARFDLAVGMGSLIAIMVSVLLFLDMQSTTSKFTDANSRGPSYKAFAQSLCLIITFIGVVVVIAFGVARLIELGYLRNYRDPLDFFVKIVLYVGVPLNTVITSALIFAEGIEGVIMILLVTITVILGVLILLNKIAQPLTVVILVVLDWVYRLILLVFNILWYILITPIKAIIAIITWPFKALRPQQG
jgi:hypothetical protein